MNGQFIVLEGSDGSGKTTQFRLLSERLKAVGYDVEVFDFPRYGEPSGYFVKSYLNGDFGPAKEVNPYTASMFYALDRFAAAAGIRQAMSEGKLVLSNRYTGSNMAHQGSKFGSEAEKRGYFLWADSLEFQLLGIPRPNLNIFLRVPAETSYELIERKAKRDYTESSRDEHEADIEHLKNSVATYDLLCSLFPKDYRPIDCVNGGKLMNIAEINDLIWETIQPYLSADIRRHKPEERSVRLDQQAEAPPRPEPPKLQISLSGSASKAAAIKSISLLGARQLLKNQFLMLSVSATGGRKPLSFYTPKLPVKVASEYRRTMARLAANRQTILEKLSTSPDSRQEADYAAQFLLPMAALVSINTVYDQARLPAALKALSGSGLDELSDLALSLSANKGAELPKVSSKDSSLSEEMSRNLTHNYADNSPTVKLVNAQPRLEFDLLADAAFESGDASLAEAEELIADWDYEQKAKLLGEVLSRGQLSVPSSELSYLWELVLDEPTIRQLVSLGAIQVQGAQTPSPRLGYDMPPIIDRAGLADLYDESYSASLRLYSTLQEAGCLAEAAYTVMSGHKSRWRTSTSYTQLVSLQGLALGKQTPELIRSTAQLMLDAVAEVHPTVAVSLPEQPLPTQVFEQKSEPKKSRPSRRRSRSASARPRRNAKK